MKILHDKSDPGLLRCLSCSKSQYRFVILAFVVTFFLTSNLTAEPYKFITPIGQIKRVPVNDIKIYEQTAYVISDNDVYIYSVSSPWSPKLETGFHSFRTISDLVNVEANRFYLCTADAANQVIEMDSLNTWGKIYFVEKLSCQKAEREGATLYTADLNIGLEIYNLSRGLLPEKLTTYSEKWGIKAMAARYPRIHALNDFGYVNIDVTDLSHPVESGKNYEIVDGTVLSVNRNYVYIGAKSSLIVLDISTPSAPRIVNRLRLSSQINALICKDNELYIGTEQSGLKVMDITNPIRIREKNSYNVISTIKAIALDTDYIYLAAGKDGWVILQYR
jgi:hypothetical protein